MSITFQHEVTSVHAERVFLQTDDQGNVTGLPKLPPSCRVEAIFLVLADEGVTAHPGPHPALAGKTHVIGDIIAPAISEVDWDMLR